MRVKLPDGNIGEFPDSMSNEEIESVLQKQFPSENKQENISPVEENRSILGRAAGLAEKYINKPIESIGLPDVAGGFLQGTANIAPGLYNLGAKASNLFPGVNLEEKKGFHFAKPGIASAIGDIGSYFLPANALSHIDKIPHIANALKKASDIIGKSPLAVQKALGVGKEASKNALLGATINPEDQGLGALLGGAGSLTGSALGYGGRKGLEKLGIGKQPGIEAIEGLDYDKLKPTLESSERLGTQLRPSEASRNPFIAGLEGKYPRTREAAYENVELGMKRLGKEKEAINKLLENIYGKSTSNDNKLSKMYENVYRWNLKPEVVNNLKENPLISDAFDSVSRDKAWKTNLKETPENNMSYIDKVKRELGDKEDSLIRSGEKGKAREYKQARKELTRTLDKSVPGYKEARNLAERKIVRESIEKKMKKAELSGSEFFKKIIENEQEFNKRLKSLRNAPEAQQNLRDMKEAWHSLINVEKPSTASYQSEKAINQARGSLQKVMEIWNQLTGKKKNLEAIKFIRSDKWIKKLQEAKDSGNKEKFNRITSEILGKITPGSLSAIEEDN